MRLPSFFGRTQSDASPQPDYFDVDGGTVYAVGDIHGEITLLESLVEKIRGDVALPGTPGPKTLVFVGDFVDRGEDSRGALEFLANLAIPDCEVVLIRGNHEQQMLDFLKDPIGQRRWLDWGGRETLASFGIRSAFPTADDDQYIGIASEFREALGGLLSMVEQRTVLSQQIGNVILCHGGMDPDISITEQNPKYLMWGSESFMTRGGPPGYWYVHGHIIHEQPRIIGNRIAVDTGAYKTGILSVARITDDGCSFLQQY